MSWVAIDGELVPRERAVVNVFDRGFLYGDSIFETMRTYGGKLFRLPEHMQRFARSVEVTHISSPISLIELTHEIERLTRETLPLLRAQDRAAELVVRVMVTRGEGPLGLLPATTAGGRRVAYLMPAITPAEDVVRKGVGVLLYPTYRPSDSARGAKVGNYLESMLGLVRAKDEGLDEALIVNASGEVVEGTTSNVFVVRDGRLITPPISAGPLPGITRGAIIEVAHELGIAFEERALRPSDLLEADEVAITSTLREIIPVSVVMGAEGRRELTPGPIAARLRKGFAALVARS